MPKLKAKDVTHLAFEGGGGKGVAYIGALDGLIEKGAFPAEGLVKAKKKRIEGISGSSAGAITALLLVLGNTPSSIADLLKRRSDFEKIYEHADPGFQRKVTKGKSVRGIVPSLRPFINVKPEEPQKGASREEQVEYLSWGKTKVEIEERRAVQKIVEERATGQFWETLVWAIYHFPLAQIKGTGLGNALYNKKRKIDRLNPVVGRDAYIYSLFYDRGIFPGFALREYVIDRIQDGLLRINPKLSRFTPKQLNYYAANIGFKELNGLTKTELVVTGCNISRGFPAYFSSKSTPKFSVAEAVAISMSIPPVFKPVWIEKSKRSHNVKSGFWLDGGTLNNLPIHAFDNPKGRGLTKGMLGIRLDVEKAERLYLSDPKKYYGKSPMDRGLLTENMDHLRELFETLLYPSEGGQIRSGAEKDQTIVLPTSGPGWELNTIEFVNSESDVEKARTAALEEVRKYFKQSS